MRDALQNAGKWLAAILEPSHVHVRARRRNATVDAVVVLALGTGWALALSYGPPPLNSAVAQIAATEANSRQVEQPAQIEGTAPTSEADNKQDAPPPDETNRRDPPPQSPQSQSVPEEGTQARSPEAPPAAKQKTSPGKSKPLPAPGPPTPPAARKASPPAVGMPAAHISPEEAVSFVEQHRLATGYGAFVDPKACTDSLLFATAPVSAAGHLAPGVAKLSLAPDPAYAVVADTGTGALTVSVFACGSLIPS